MWRSVLMFSVLAVSAAEAGQARSSFQVGVTITGPALTQKPVSATSVPLPRPRPAEGAMRAIPQPPDPAPK